MGFETKWETDMFAVDEEDPTMVWFWIVLDQNGICCRKSDSTFYSVAQGHLPLHLSFNNQLLEEEAFIQELIRIPSSKLALDYRLTILNIVVILIDVSLQSGATNNSILSSIIW